MSPRNARDCRRRVISGVCFICRPIGTGIRRCLCDINANEPTPFPRRRSARAVVVTPAYNQDCAMELSPSAAVSDCRSGRRGLTQAFLGHAGEMIMRALPSERPPSQAGEGVPLSDSKAELPPIVRRADVVAFALVALLVITIVAVLYEAKAFFLPVAMAFVVGTMLSPAANFLERYRIPRPIGAVLIVTSVAAAVAFLVGLIA